MTPLLKPVELLYRGVNRARRALYRAGILRAKRLPKPVISIGNVSMGGAGKTPTVIAIAQFLIERGHRVAVLTRGYGRSGEGGEVTELDPERFGDEPVLIKKSAPNAIVFVGSNRYDNGIQINCDVYLLDDGFQHLQLHRDLDVVIDTPPAGWRREGPSALRDADMVIPRRLRTLVPPGITRAFAFSGLANNDQFFDSLRAAGVELAGARSFPDHYRYTATDVEAIKHAARNAGAATIVTTEKDAVKLRDGAIIAVPSRMEIEADVLERIAAIVGER